jgi:hypothetical protein
MEQAWMDLPAAARTVGGIELPPLRLREITGVAGALAAGWGKVRRSADPPAATSLARGAGLLHLTLVAAEREPGQVVATYERALDTLIPAPYQWPAIWKAMCTDCGTQAKGDKRPQDTDTAPTVWSVYFNGESDFSQRLLAGFQAVARTAAWESPQTRARLLGKTQELVRKVLPEYSRVGTLCSLAAMLAEGERPPTTAGQPDADRSKQ